MPQNRYFMVYKEQFYRTVHCLLSVCQRIAADQEEEAILNGRSYQQDYNFVFEIQCHIDNCSSHPPLIAFVSVSHPNNRSNCPNSSTHSCPYPSYPGAASHPIDRVGVPSLYQTHILEQSFS